MKPGIFSRTFESCENIDENFERVAAAGLECVQLNLLSASLDTLPEEIEDRELSTIAKAARRHDIEMSALSGTFNMIDPDREARVKACRQFELQCRIARKLGIPVISLCTGSKNLQSKWKWHPDNATPEAWRDLLETTEIILRCAEATGIVLGVEIEDSNIINTASLAQKYLAEMRSPCLKIVMDGANLYHAGQARSMKDTLREAFDTVGEHIVLAHAKDYIPGEATAFTGPGLGVLDFEFYIGLLKEAGYDGALIMHGMKERDVGACTAYLKRRLQ